MATDAWIAGKILVLFNRPISVQECVHFLRAAGLTAGVPDSSLPRLASYHLASCHHGGAGPSHDRSPLPQVRLCYYPSITS